MNKDCESLFKCFLLIAIYAINMKAYCHQDLKNALFKGLKYTKGTWNKPAKNWPCLAKIHQRNFNTNLQKLVLSRGLKKNPEQCLK